MRHLGLVIPALALVLVGLAFIHSAGAGHDYAQRQVVWVLVAGVTFAAALLFRSLLFSRGAYVVFGLCLLLLLLVLAAGHVAGGSSRWLALGPLRLQPSELTKVALVLVLARALRRRADLRTWHGLVTPLGLTFLPMLLIVQQPDLGTAVTLLPITGCMLLAAGMRVRHMVVLGAVGLLALPVLWFGVMDSYQKGRVIGYLNPEGNEVGWAYQMNQSKIAVGSGGVGGKGLGEGTQSQLNFLPERHTDFIFAVICEEWGLAGALLVLGLYAALLSSVMSVARSTRDPVGRLVCVGVAALFGVQVFVNTGMNVGLLPITGLTLPLVSYGGSSLMTFAVALGLVHNVARHRVRVLAGEGFA